MNVPHYEIREGDVIDQLRLMPEKSVQCVTTSPPYYGLRDYGVEGQIGLEKLHDCFGYATGQPCGECYVCHLVAVFDEVWRVLRDDGVVWLNVADSYFAGGSTTAKSQDGNNWRDKSTLSSALTPGQSSRPVKRRKDDILKPKDMMLMPSRLALALQVAGWYVRADVAWTKPNAMPESVRDRPAKSWEHVFMLTKSSRCYFDMEAVRQPLAVASKKRLAEKTFDTQTGGDKDPRNGGDGTMNRSARTSLENVKKAADAGQGANLRDVWRIPTKGYKGAHFATFPKRIPELCIKSSTSEKGECSVCGMPWKRVVKRTKMVSRQSERGRLSRQNMSRVSFQATQEKPASSITLGWQPTCSCNAEPIPQTVLDIFMGSGTTLEVANELGRRSIGIELNPEYCALAFARIEASISRRATEEAVRIVKEGLPPEKAKDLPGIIQTTFLED